MSADGGLSAGGLGAGDDWSPPRLVAPHAPAPVVLGEMAEVRRAWRRARWQRWGRRVWPAFVALLLLVIVASVVLLGFLLEF